MTEHSKRFYKEMVGDWSTYFFFLLTWPFIDVISDFCAPLSITVRLSSISGRFNVSCYVAGEVEVMFLDDYMGWLLFEHSGTEL